MRNYIAAAIFICTAIGCQATHTSNAVNNESFTGIDGGNVCSNNLVLFNEKHSPDLSLSDTEFRAKHGISLLEAFSSSRDIGAVKRLLQNSGATNSQYSVNDVESALFAAVSSGDVLITNELLKYLKKNTTNNALSESVKKKSLLVTAAFCEHVDVVDLLLQLNFDPNETDEQGLDAMMLSIAASNTEIARSLIKYGYKSCANKTGNGQHVKELATAMNQFEIAALLNSCAK